MCEPDDLIQRNDKLWKEKNVKGLREFASTVTEITEHGNLLLFTENSTVELYLQIRDSIIFNDPDEGYMWLLHQILGYAPLEVYCAFVSCSTESLLFTNADVQLQLMMFVTTNYTILSKDKCRVISEFLNIEEIYPECFADMLEDYTTIKIEAYRFLFELLDCTLQRMGLLCLRQRIFSKRNKNAKAIVKLIDSKL